MSDDDNQGKIIQEQNQANERIIRSVDDRDGSFQGQAPINERVIEQVQPNERIQQVQPPSQEPQNDSED